VLLFLHTQRELSVGWNLDKIIRLFNIGDKTAFSAGLSGIRGVSLNDLCLIYNVSDVFLSTSCGEGFCLPLIEEWRVVYQ